ncbi:MAG: Flp pilus assembly complex ATPase component TadA, partial [Sulfurimonas sp.]|nr:Flp pilus assembly complex ATPase component TadA [Sulfurimonas sp.]
MQEDSGEEDNDEDISLTDFLRTSSDILTSEESAPIIKFVNALFYQAVKKKASDIHIEIQEKRGEVRFRIDGMLSKNADLDKKVVSLIVSRIKVISNLDISEKRIPQDGRTQIKIAGQSLDVRVSILPTFYGERVVMRLLMQSSQIPKIDELGFNSELIYDVKKLLRSSHGIILVTGPTGSGKTTSLHSFLREVESPEKNLITVEDPVEYKSDNIAQIQVNEKVGLTFASALRSILRQDPDVI